MVLQYANICNHMLCNCSDYINVFLHTLVQGCMHSKGYIYYDKYGMLSMLIEEKHLLAY